MRPAGVAAAPTPHNTPVAAGTNVAHPQQPPPQPPPQQAAAAAAAGPHQQGPPSSSQAVQAVVALPPAWHAPIHAGDAAAFAQLQQLQRQQLQLVAQQQPVSQEQAYEQQRPAKQPRIALASPGTQAAAWDGHPLQTPRAFKQEQHESAQAVPIHTPPAVAAAAAVAAAGAVGAVGAAGCSSAVAVPSSSAAAISMGAAVPASSGVGVAAAGQLSAGQLQGYSLLALQQQQMRLALQQQQTPLQMSGVAGAVSAGAVAAAPSGSQMQQQQQCVPVQLQMAQQLQQAQLLQLQLLAAQQQGVAQLAAGGLMLHNGDSQERPTIEALQQVYHLPAGDAARALGVGATTLKQLCRQYGITRWPYRKRQSVLQLIQRVEAHAQASGDAAPEAVECALQKLRGLLDQIQADPNIDIDGPVKRLRQAFFKEAHAARKKEEQESSEQQGAPAPATAEKAAAAARPARTAPPRGPHRVHNLCKALAHSQEPPGAAAAAGAGEGEGFNEGGEGGEPVLDDYGYAQFAQEGAEYGEAATYGDAAALAYAGLHAADGLDDDGLLLMQQHDDVALGGEAAGVGDGDSLLAAMQPQQQYAAEPPLSYMDSLLLQQAHMHAPHHLATAAAAAEGPHAHPGGSQQLLARPPAWQVS